MSKENVKPKENISGVENYLNKSEMFKTAVNHCNQIIGICQNILNILNKADNEHDIIESGISISNSIESQQSNTVLKNRDIELIKNKLKEIPDIIHNESNKFKHIDDNKDSDKKEKNINSLNSKTAQNIKIKDNNDELNNYDVDENNEEIEHNEYEENNDVYTEGNRKYIESCVAISRENGKVVKFVENSYKKYYILHNFFKPQHPSDCNVYYFKIIHQVKPATRKINYGSVPENWIVPVPIKKLNSEYYKEYLKDGSLLTKIYTDMNFNMRNKIKSELRNNITYNTTDQFISKIKTLAHIYKYFLKTDIVGAYYNVNYKTILSTLRANSDISKKTEEYLLGLFNVIKSKENDKEYLYVTNYSPLLFGIYLKRILSDIRFISRYDDIVLYGNNLDKLKEQFDKLTKILKTNGLYLNRNKTTLYDTDINSIFILKNLINIPSSGKLDDVTKNILKEYKKNGEYIKIACRDENDIIKLAL